MKKWPVFDDNGDLPVGIHQATINQEFKTKAAPEQAFLNEVHMLCVMNA